jgi:hypothetical protein
MTQLIASNQSYVLSKNGNPVKCDRYLYGFQSKYLASHACSYIKADPKIVSNVRDVTTEMNEYLKQWQIRPDFRNVQMDTSCTMTFVKHEQQTFTLHEVRHKDLLLEPFENDTGLAYIYAIEEETEDGVTYKTQLIEPSDQSDVIINSLGFLVPMWHQYPIIL